MKQFVLDYLSAETAKMDGARAYTPIGHDADLHIQLKSGRQIAVYVINRALRLPEIRETYEGNTARRLHTMFIIDQRILPEHGEETEAAYWMTALHALTHGRIYTYRCEKRTVTIHPLHIEWKWGVQQRQFEYGPAVKIDGLRTDVLDCSNKYIVGMFAIADFGEAPFWKKRSPMDDAKGQKYSWRNFSFRSEKKRATPPPQDDDWDTWQDFESHYGDVGEDFDFEFNFDWANEQQQRRAGTGSKERYSVVDSAHYALLGVNIGATLEEVKRAYRMKAREFHPDLHPHAKKEYTDKMIEINAAFEAIRKQLEREQ